jgi:hypothetical protein
MNFLRLTVYTVGAGSVFATYVDSLSRDLDFVLYSTFICDAEEVLYVSDGDSSSLTIELRAWIFQVPALLIVDDLIMIVRYLKSMPVVVFSRIDCGLM